MTGGEVAASFVAEGAPAAVSRGSLGTLSLSARKLVCLTEISEELLNYGLNVAPTLRQLMGAGIASALDSAFFSIAAASASTPAGILLSVVATTASTATPPSEAARADLRALVAVLTAPSDPVFIAAAARALYLATLLPSDFGYPVLASAAVPAARVICVDAGALVPGHGTEARFSSSRDATLHEEDTSPAAIGTPGSPAAVAAPTRWLFQSDAIAIRATLFVGWAVRTGGVSYVDATW